MADNRSCTEAPPSNPATADIASVTIAVAHYISWTLLMIDGNPGLTEAASCRGEPLKSCTTHHLLPPSCFSSHSFASSHRSLHITTTAGFPRPLAKTVQYLNNRTSGRTLTKTGPHDVAKFPPPSRTALRCCRSMIKIGQRKSLRYRLSF